MADKLARDSEVRKATVTHVRRSRQVDEERLAGLSREVSQMVKFTVVTTNCEKSAEAVVGKPELAGVVIDRFGHDVWLIPQGEDHFKTRVLVSVSPQFFGWVTGIGSGMKITGTG